MESRADFAELNARGHCKHYEKGARYGFQPDVCRRCKHRPLYTADCDLERDLPKTTKPKGVK